MPYQDLLNTTFIKQVDFHNQLDSTNTRALHLAETANIDLPAIVIAQQQTAGRGRGENRWWSTDGALTFSVILDLADWNLSPSRCPQIALIAGLAIAESFRAIDQKLPVGLKWPNDVFIDGKKICGILTEVPVGMTQRVVIGVGMNVNNSFHDAPQQLSEIGTSLTDHLQQPFDLCQVLQQVLQDLQSVIEMFSTNKLALADSWKPNCILQGREVEVVAGSKATKGTCLGIDDEGALLLQDQQEIHRCFAGVVTRSSYLAD